MDALFLLIFYLTRSPFGLCSSPWCMSKLVLWRGPPIIFCVGWMFLQSPSPLASLPLPMLSVSRCSWAISAGWEWGSSAAQKQKDKHIVICSYVGCVFGWRMRFFVDC